VPQLRGAKVKDAKATLRANGCRVGKVKRAKGRGVKHGRVLRQSRRAGKTLDAGTKIHLRVRR
jgi:beta-lactam-binding protein with PASTA domain